jgi:hypothetical protein
LSTGEEEDIYYLVAGTVLGIGPSCLRLLQTGVDRVFEGGTAPGGGAVQVPLGGGTGVPGANNPTTPTQSSPNPSTNLTCANIPGGCSHPGDTFTSGGTGVVRNGVSYGIPEGAYCENPAGTPGVIRNNACEGTAL